MATEPARPADDAPGRVDLLVVRAPADVLEPAEPPPPTAASRVPGRALTLLMSHDGWIAVAILAVAVVVVFVLGLWFTR